MDLKLSQPQSECIQAARENNGRLYRYDSNVTYVVLHKFSGYNQKNETYKQFK